MTDSLPSSPGYAFAFFRSHCLDAERPYHGEGWYAPDYRGGANRISVPEKWPRCECGEGWLVWDLYHWHGSDGRCHNAVKCR